MGSVHGLDHRKGVDNAKPQSLIAAPVVTAAISAGKGDGDDFLSLPSGGFPERFGIDRRTEAAGGRRQWRYGVMQRVRGDIRAFGIGAGSNGDMIGCRDGWKHGGHPLRFGSFANEFRETAVPG